MLLEVREMDYQEIRRRLEEAYRRTPNAQSFLQEILLLWSEYGFLEGEWSCELPQAGRSRTGTPLPGEAALRSGAAASTG